VHPLTHICTETVFYLYECSFLCAVFGGVEKEKETDRHKTIQFNYQHILIYLNSLCCELVTIYC